MSRWLTGVPHPYSEENAKSWLDRCKRLSEQGPERSGFEFAIELKSERKVIGGVSLIRIHRFHGTAGGGLWLNARYHGQGYGTEAFSERTRFAFEDLGLRRLDNGCFVGNDASFKLQQRLGFKVEGERKKAFRCMADGQLKDECVVALLRDEWEKGLTSAAKRTRYENTLLPR